jgi:putative transposase
MELRKITYRMYPSAAQIERLLELLGLHQRLYNTALEERIRVYAETGKSLGFSAQCKEVTAWRKLCDSLDAVNAQSLQVTLKRLDLAYKAFFRRVKAGETAGFPRFKPIQRFKGWGYKTYGDGWKLFQDASKHGQVRLTGVGEIRMRGQGRFSGTPKTAEVLHKAGKWYLSVTYNVAPESLTRTPGTEAGAFDWGLTTLLTLAKSDGTIETVENPRWLKSRLDAIKALQRTVSIEEIKAKAVLGLAANEPLKKGQRLPVTSKLKRLYAQVRSVHSKIARQRHDFYHKLTATLVSRFAFLATEELAVRNMSKKPKAKPDPDKAGEYLPNGATAKAGLNRSILDAAPSMLLGMLLTKAVEAGSLFAKANTREVKPTQRCHCCGQLVKKELSERIHRCSCGCVCGRDENASKTLLRWLLEGDFWVGTAQAELLGVLPGSARNSTYNDSAFLGV